MAQSYSRALFMFLEHSSVPEASKRPCATWVDTGDDAADEAAPG
jgi:hypothetical protein